MSGRRPWTIRGMMLAIALLSIPFAGLAWLSRAIGAAREAARASQCVGNLKQIGLALWNYESDHGTLPPAYATDAAGRPLLSWRVLILPYLEQRSLYARFRLDEPWDGPNNITLLDEMPPIFACPTHQPGVSWSAPGRFTNYLATAGPGTAFPGSDPIRFDSIKDGIERTILVVESNQADVPWTAPVDLDVRAGGLVHMPDAPARGPTTRHPSGLTVATAENRILRFDPAELRRLLPAFASIAGGEEADPRSAP